MQAQKNREAELTLETEASAARLRAAIEQPGAPSARRRAVHRVLHCSTRLKIWQQLEGRKIIIKSSWTRVIWDVPIGFLIFKIDTHRSSDTVDGTDIAADMKVPVLLLLPWTQKIGPFGRCVH